MKSDKYIYVYTPLLTVSLTKTEVVIVYKYSKYFYLESFEFIVIRLQFVLKRFHTYLLHVGKTALDLESEWQSGQNTPFLSGTSWLRIHLR